MRMETQLEYILTNSYKADMIIYLQSHPKDFEEAIKLALSDKQPYAWRAAWLLWSCMENNDPRVQAHVEKIIDSINSKSDGHKKDLFKILEMMEIGHECEGKLFDICVDVWEKTDKKPAVRLNAFRLLIKIAKKHKELSQEICLLTQSQYTDSLSKAAQRSLNGLLSKLMS